MENDKDILLISIFTFLTISLWIFFELVKTTKTSTISIPTKEITKTIPIKIDNEVLRMLEQKKLYR
ncbi:hypothetical protein ACFL1A_03615 [Patescibacteria group bacterium]